MSLRMKGFRIDFHRANVLFVVPYYVFGDPFSLLCGEHPDEILARIGVSITLCAVGVIFVYAGRVYEYLVFIVDDSWPSFAGAEFGV